MSQYSTLFVKNLIFSGIHGSTGREKFDPQRFKIDIEVTLDVSRSAESDQLCDTYDYNKAAAIARHVIENERHVLIEKIVARIAEHISNDPKVFSAKVTVKKIDGSHNGYPGITYLRKRSPQESESRILDFDMSLVIDKIQSEHGISIPFLTDAYRETLLSEARSYEYVKQPEIVGAAKVREELSSVQKIREGGLFASLKNDFEITLKRKLMEIGKNPFNPELSFNEMSLQKYEVGSIGITPHVDGLSCKNLICIFILTGKAKFAFCDDRAGSNPRYLDTTPGNLILFRAPGFMNSDFRPFHFLSDVTEQRIVFGLRQNVKSTSAQ
jgi:dihydroneopterin aldolase